MTLFVLLTALAIAVSFQSWRNQKTYGIFRFFAFEALVLLIVWNLSRWFRNPFSLRQIVSWFLIAASSALAVHGVYLLRVVGGAQERFIEATQTVVEVGAYRYIRHPLYAALMLFGWGVFFKGPDLVSGSLALGATAFLITTARFEEAFNLERLGSAYADYMKRTKMFIPFLL